MKYPSITLVIPCYNESDRVGLMYDGLEEFNKYWPSEWNAVIVNDGSKDNTETALYNHPLYQVLQSKLKIISQQNTGKGGALKNGIQYANLDYTLTLDADMAARPIELMKWIYRRGEFESNEILIGSREHKESEVDKIPHRKLIGNIFNFLIRMLTGLNLLDTQCGFKLYYTKHAKSLFEALQTLGWAHDVEILCRASKKGLKIDSLPLKWKAIEGSKINVIKDSYKMFVELLKIRSLVK